VPLLAVGSTGAKVMALQERLQSLGYWLGGAQGLDGIFGPLTQQAVYAFQKLNKLTPDGEVTPATYRALARAGRPTSSGPGSYLEVDNGRQVLLVVSEGRVLWAFNTSTGTGQWYWSGSKPNRAVTPDGRWRVFRQVDGYDTSDLGVLYRPKYVVGGVAVHGYPSVPPYPASHGCIRLTNAAMDFLWSSRLAPLGSTVWVHG
jgi:N-acetylmuramoyl-L-alanine amidase